MIRWRISSHTRSFGRLEAVSVALVASAASANAPTRSMNAKSQPTVAVSYSWKTEGDGAYKQTVDEFCARVEAAGIRVFRDTKVVQLGDNLIRFMRDLGSGDRICVFLSDSYLRSDNCMYELVTAWRRSPDNPEEFDRRVRVWVMKEAVSIRTPEDRDRWVEYWVDQRESAKARVSGRHGNHVSSAKVEDTANRIRDIAEHVSDILEHIHERLSPADNEAFVSWVRQVFPNPSPEAKETKERPKEAVSADARLEEVYRAVFEDLDDELRSNPSVAPFLAGICSDCLAKRDGQTVVRRLGSGERHVYAEAIEKVGLRIRGFSGGRQDRHSLALVMGGFAVLTVDPAWVLHQRHALIGSPVEVPAREQLLSIQDGKQVDFLHLIVRALVGGLGTLSSMFGCNDHRRVRESFAESQRAVGEANLVPAVMRYVIRVTRPSTADLSKLSGKELEDEFQKSKSTLSYELKKKKRPYWIPEAETVGRLHPYRKDLALDDLLLVLPSGSGTEEALVKDVMALVSNLKDIFEHLKPDLQ